MATHSSVLAWRIPGTGEPGGLPSLGSHRVRHDWRDLAAAAAECYLEVTNEMALKYVIPAQKVCSSSFRVQVFSTPSFLPSVWTFIWITVMNTLLAKLYNHSDSTSVRVMQCQHDTMLGPWVCVISFPLGLPSSAPPICHGTCPIFRPIVLPSYCCVGLSKSLK